ncbi:MAG: GNAT family N-acetyltransferase [Clostridia bacterium]|nr:GNAT family N-acetyltransferase [Clostridia bacterium]
MGEIYHGKGNESLYGEYMDFINYVFGFNGTDRDFKKLLPKLYKPEDRPVESSYVTLDDGKIRAAVGAFDHSISVCGECLKCRGIGNVAVHPYERSKGYMKALMNMATQDMISDGVDLSILGGRRQRYNYFSYEKTGVAYNFTLNSDNMRHVYGKDRSAYHTLTVKKLRSEDNEALDAIAALTARQPYSPVREREQLYDILVSWQCVPYAFIKQNETVGFCVVGGGKKVHEIVLQDKNDFVNAVISLYDALKQPSISVCLPPFCTEYIAQLYNVCEGYEITTPKSFSVFNYKRVITAFLHLKATYTELPEGEFCMLVHGVAGDERLQIRIRNDVVKVEEYKGEVDIELDHIDAMNLLFSPFCPERDKLSHFARILLPLPLWLYSADAV